MKFVRFLAMMLAMMLLGTTCIATASAEEEEYGIHDATLLPAMDMTYADWMSSPEIRAIFVVLFQLELADYEEEYMTSSLMDTYGIPTIFLSEVSGDLYGDAISMYLFFEDENSDNNVLVTTTYVVSCGFYNGFVMDIEGDPTMIMDLLSTSEGSEFVYYPVTFEEYYNALMTINSIVNGEG